MSGQDTQTLIVGLGQTGLSVIRFLSTLGEQPAIADSRRAPPQLTRLRAEFPEVDCHLGEFDADRFCQYGRIVLSPGVAVYEPAVQTAIERGMEVIGDIELFARHVDRPVIAVTGSNGKSTVACLLREMALNDGVDVRAGGNLGPPALDLLADGHAELYILELSSFQLETTHSLKPQVACVLNVSADHMDRYRDLADYAAAKWRIYDQAGVCIFNRDDAMSRPPNPCRGDWRAYSLDRGEVGDYRVGNVASRRWLVRDERALVPVDEIRISGRHNLANAVAAVAIADAAGLSVTAMRKGLREFPGLAHRTEWVAGRDGVDWYNDSKATNVGAAMAALDGFDRPLVWIAGGDGKGADFAPLRDVAARQVRAAILIGRDAKTLADALGSQVPIRMADNMEQAVRMAKDLAQPGDAVLLSPACASFDMFDGFAHRGEVFATAVRNTLQ